MPIDWVVRTSLRRLDITTPSDPVVCQRYTNCLPESSTYAGIGNSRSRGN